MISGAEAIIKCLEAEKVSVVFGYPGAAVCPLYDKLTHSDIRHILVRQEQNAGHAASGYARISGKTGVCISTSGPGATNLITAIATAYMDSIPLVAITGQVSLELLGRDVFQEADITGACAPFVKHSYLITDAADIPRVFKEAFHIASTGRPGPVLIDIPVNIQNAEINFKYPETVTIRGYNPSIKGHPFQIKKAVNAINNAKKPLICAGGGIFGSKAEQHFRSFADTTDIPVVCTMMGLSVLPSDHPLNLGMVGMYGSALANRALYECDTLIVIGARLGDRFLGQNGASQKLTNDTTIIHIDVDPAEIGKNIGTNIPIVGDAKTILEQFMENDLHPDTETWKTRLCSLQTVSPVAPSAGNIPDMREVMRLISEKAAADAILAVDVGLNQIDTAIGYKIKNGRFISSCGMGTMGYALPAACGAKLASPDTTVFAVMGDGGFQMSMNELATAAENKIPLKLVVDNNLSLGMVCKLQTQNFGEDSFSFDLSPYPDIRYIAKAYGISYARLDSMENADEVIAQLLNDPDESFILEVMTCRNLKENRKGDK
ncbi:MAG: biosynthetic-type acetolactate synthase large subunit [Oscillospiraceae bacterium]|nr:biosynthetic-type acetolactate synthase large subunit [Oscillospiraceae bacterium]